MPRPAIHAAQLPQAATSRTLPSAVIEYSSSVSELLPRMASLPPTASSSIQMTLSPATEGSRPVSATVQRRVLIES